MLMQDEVHAVSRHIILQRHVELLQYLHERIDGEEPTAIGAQSVATTNLLQIVLRLLSFTRYVQS